jgi:hypothetical protein
MTYSNGRWFDDSYNVQYATSTSPTGPWTYGGSVLGSDANRFGPGHHSITQFPGCDDYYIVYHRYQDRTYKTRLVAIDHLTFNADGSIQKVNMTPYGVAPRPAGSACPVSPLLVSGGLYKLTHKDTDQVLDVDNGSTAPGANVQQFTDNGTNAQRWTVTLQADGHYKLLNKNSGHALDVAGASAAPGTNVQQWTDNGNDAQRWQLQAMSGGFYKLLHKGTDQALDVASNSVSPGANVQQYTDNGNDAQRWQLNLVDQPIVSGGVYRLTHKGTTQCLEVPSNSASPGTAVQQYTDNGNDAQRWVITRMADGYYKLTHRNTNQCLEVASNSTSLGATVQQYTDNGNDAQRWQIVPLGDGYCKLVHKGATLCLDVDNNLSDPGTGVHQWTDNGNDAQRWRLDLMPQNVGNTVLKAKSAAELTGPAPLTVYPVPATNQVHFVVTPAQTGTLTLDVLDTQGRLVRRLATDRGVQGQAAEYLLDGSTWAAGVYTVRLNMAGQVSHTKLVLVH